MAWNEPGGNKPKDPWGGDQGPPDLDEAFRKFKDKFGGNKGSGGGNKSSGDLPEFSGKMAAVALAILAVLYVAMGFYTVDAQEEAVVLRFGKYHETVKPGLHFNWPMVDDVHKVNVTKQRSQRIGGLMLTEDENIVDISLSVQYTISDSKAFSLEVRNPEMSLQNAADSALRHVVGSVSLHDVLTEGRKAVTIEIETRLQNYLNAYHTGIDVTTINIEDAQPPKDVQSAFDDVIRAKEDQQRATNEAQTYQNGIIPEARGMAQRQLEEANAYKEQVIAKAAGETKRFDLMRAEYEKAPQVTRQRLYIDSMEKVLSNSSKVLIDVDGSNMMYLPLDKIIANANSAPVKVKSTFIDSSIKQAPSSRSSDRSTIREAR